MPTRRLFNTVADQAVRRVLRAKDSEVTVSDVSLSVELTLNALGRDAVRDDVTEDLFQKRRAAAKEATQRVAELRRTGSSRDMKRTVASLRRYWSIWI
jgi:hypothetical protein